MKKFYDPCDIANKLGDNSVSIEQSEKIENKKVVRYVWEEIVDANGASKRCLVKKEIDPETINEGLYWTDFELDNLIATGNRDLLKPVGKLGLDRLSADDIASVGVDNAISAVTEKNNDVE